jgi:signal transduction histidine kinase/ActR/RegA family two-component response regulator
VAVPLDTPSGIPWYARLEARVLLAVTLVAGVSLAIVLLVTGQIVTRSSLDVSSRDLLAARGAFDRLVESRKQSAAKATRLIVELPIFRASLTDSAVAADHVTIEAMARDYCAKLGAELCLVANSRGAWIGRTGFTANAVVPPSIQALATAAQSGTSASALVTMDDALYLAVSEPARFTTEVLGTFTAGYRLDDRAAAELASVTNSEVTFVCRGLCGSSLPAAQRAALAADLAHAPSTVGLTDAAPALRTLGGVSYVGGRYRLETAGGEPVSLVLLRDWAPTAATLRQIDLAMLGTAAVVLVIGLAGAFVFSRRLTQPLRDLSHVAGAITAGRDAGHVTPTGPVETRRMAAAFNRMTTTLQALRQREEQLRQAQKMEAIGRLAGGVAHDFNNLLTAILGYADLLVDGMPDGDPKRRPLVEIQKAGRTAASLTRDLLAFSRKQVLQPIVVSLNAVIEQTDGLLRRLVGEDVEIVLDLDPDLPRILADPAQISQVLLNLAVNARDAMPGGGRLAIRTRAPRLEAMPASSQPSMIELEIADTGCGMTDAIRARIFEPFFTTKGVGRGTGLGLATVYGIIEQSGGQIEVESAPGAGTRFVIRLPATDAAAPAERPAVADDVRPAATETVLLVEDNDAVRAMARDALAGDGYRVIEAANGELAMRAAARDLDRIALVLTDVVMPVMGGRELVAKLRALRPELKVLFTSGYASDPDTVRHARAFGAGFIQKPFVPSSLRRAVRQAIDKLEV